MIKIGPIAKHQKLIIITYQITKETIYSVYRTRLNYRGVIL